MARSVDLKASHSNGTGHSAIRIVFLYSPRFWLDLLNAIDRPCFGQNSPVRTFLQLRPVNRLQIAPGVSVVGFGPAKARRYSL
jgi:hypothetical protein